MDRRVIACIAAFGFAGCAQVLGIADWEVTDAAVSAEAGDAGGDSPGAKTCASPKSGTGAIDGVLVLNEFCIDSTEATVQSYSVFMNDLASNPSVGQAPECSWNTTYKPGYDPYLGVFADESALPQTTIDWCDAVAYCKYWGKHLCGARGDGGALTTDELTVQPLQSQWFTACSNGTTQNYPYGNTLQPSACNTDRDPSYGEILPVDASPACQGGVPGLFDMVGNVSEWENYCIPGDAGAMSDMCSQRGGPLFFKGTDCNCPSFGGNYMGARGVVDPHDLSPWNGIRCCWEP